MPIPRFRIRTLMIAVAVVGVSIAGYRATTECLRLRAEYRRKAGYHGRHEVTAKARAAIAEQGQALAEDAAAEAERQVADADRRTALTKNVRYCEAWRDYWVAYVVFRTRQRAQCEQLVTHHSALARRYARAARYPWWSVPRDPEEPEDPLLSESMRPTSPPTRSDF